MQKSAESPAAVTKVDPDTDEFAAAPARARLSYIIARLDRAIRRKIDELVEPYGLTTTQYTALSVLQNSHGLSNAQLARHSYITPQSTIQMIDVLERKGLIERTPDPSHRRILRARLTSLGTEVLTRCDDAVENLEKQITRDFPAEELAAFERLLGRCVHTLGIGSADR